MVAPMDDGKGWAPDDENGNLEVLSSYAHLHDLVSLMRSSMWILCRKVSYYKVIKDYDKNDFIGVSVIHGLK